MVAEKTKKCGFSRETPTENSLAKRPEGKGWQFVRTEDDRKAWIRIRKLTPKECFRLMDVSDEDIEKLLNSGISNSQLYKLAGNSIVVSCMTKIFSQLWGKKGE
jgi:site-specific DNA-cytosine methylase